MRTSHINLQISIEPEICVLAALTLFLVPWRWFFAWTFAAFFHELSHYVVLRLCRNRVSALQIGIGGIVMQTDSLSPVSEIICASAGPVGSLLLTLLSPIMPKVAICGLFHFLYNLLPVYPQDGGRILHGILMSRLPVVLAERITKIVGAIIVLLLIIMMLYWCLWRSLGYLPLIMALILLLKIKIPCKQRQ